MAVSKAWGRLVGLESPSLNGHSRARRGRASRCLLRLSRVAHVHGCGPIEDACLAGASEGCSIENIQCSAETQVETFCGQMVAPCDCCCWRLRDRPPIVLMGGVGGYRSAPPPPSATPTVTSTASPAAPPSPRDRCARHGRRTASPALSATLTAPSTAGAAARRLTL